MKNFKEFDVVIISCIQCKLPCPLKNKEFKDVLAILIKNDARLIPAIPRLASDGYICKNATGNYTIVEELRDLIISKSLDGNSYSTLTIADLLHISVSGYQLGRCLSDKVRFKKFEMKDISNVINIHEAFNGEI